MDEYQPTELIFQISTENFGEVIVSDPMIDEIMESAPPDDDETEVENSVAVGLEIDELLKERLELMFRYTEHMTMNELRQAVEAKENN